MSTTKSISQLPPPPYPPTPPPDEKAVKQGGETREAVGENVPQGESPDSQDGPANQPGVQSQYVKEYQSE